GDVDYQERLSRAFRRRRLHPSTELRVWEYAIGRPQERIEMTTKLSMDARLAAERELFLKLDIEQLEELAGQSQALIDKALAMVEAQRAPNRATLPGVGADTTNNARIETLVNTRVRIDDVGNESPPSSVELPASAGSAEPLHRIEPAHSADSGAEPAAN